MMKTIQEQLLRKTYYVFRPLMPRWFQVGLRRTLAHAKLKKVGSTWPINPQARKPPRHWTGWPGGKRFALVLTHDVETQRGQGRCARLADVEQRLGLRSSFNFVPERYHVSPQLRENLVERGFEVGVHGLKHDGKLYASRKTFRRRAARINHYLRAWDAVGFRSPAMHHNLSWIQQDLAIDYDLSTFDTDPFEPQSDGVQTIFPFLSPHADAHNKAFVEMPYTLAQDFTLFILLGEKSSAIWKQKMAWIVRNGGMVLLNTHPDYMTFEGEKRRVDEYPIDFYINFLIFIKKVYGGQFYHPLPSEMANFWRNQNIQALGQ